MTNQNYLMKSAWKNEENVHLRFLIFETSSQRYLQKMLRDFQKSWNYTNYENWSFSKPCFYAHWKFFKIARPIFNQIWLDIFPSSSYLGTQRSDRILMLLFWYSQACKGLVCPPTHFAHFNCVVLRPCNLSLNFLSRKYK